MDSLKDRLRRDGIKYQTDTFNEAADRIERLEKLLGEARCAYTNWMAAGSPESGTLRDELSFALSTTRLATIDKELQQ